MTYVKIILFVVVVLASECALLWLIRLLAGDSLS